MGKKNFDVEQIAKQARDDFDLGALLREGPVLTKTVRVFTDKVTGAKIGGAETIHEVNEYGLRVPRVRTWGLTGEIVELAATEESEKENAAAIAALKKEVAALATKLEETAIVITLQSIPPEIKKDAKRAARKARGINGKLSVEDPRFEEFADEFDAQLLERTVVEYVTNANGETHRGITLESARALKSYLDESEFAKINDALNELLWTRQISEAAVEDADF